jgi:hypothetical protein
VYKDPAWEILEAAWALCPPTTSEKPSVKTVQGEMAMMRKDTALLPENLRIVPKQDGMNIRVGGETPNPKTTSGGRRAAIGQLLEVELVEIFDASKDRAAVYTPHSEPKQVAIQQALSLSTNSNSSLMPPSVNMHPVGPAAAKLATTQPASVITTPPIAALAPPLQHPPTAVPTHSLSTSHPPAPLTIPPFVARLGRTWQHFVQPNELLAAAANPKGYENAHNFISSIHFRSLGTGPYNTSTERKGDFRSVVVTTFLPHYFREVYPLQSVPPDHKER